MLLPLARPVTVTPEVRALCEELVPGEAAERVEVDVPPWAEENDCVKNVPSVIELHGGSMEYGWQLWERLPGLLIEAEFHAVWVSEFGRRVDVTPKEIPGIEEIVFLPDPKIVYNGRQINSVRRVLTHDPLVVDLVATLDTWFEAINRGKLADFHGAMRLTPELLAIQQRRAQLEQAIAEKYYS